MYRLFFFLNQLPTHCNSLEHIRQEPDSIDAISHSEIIHIGIFLKNPKNLELGDILKVNEPNPQLNQENQIIQRSGDFLASWFVY